MHNVDEPPQTDGATAAMAGSNEIRRVCLNRHQYAVNCAFADWSIRKVELKELWTLKWHKNYHTRGPWTLAGNVSLDRWPKWMKSLTDY